ncbi:hypothetical protein IHV25_09100 [Phaeovibrio sulfidiphilus]|uniref:PEP-CTERM protein-sorting domain-containing protein n=1 Tax=Phaeovibrio sulfidiphilus TaxID=1220600 RepID=A0A8J7CQ34_9PROT|nr:hypothetical protein [Phaeovibrio sulfidiphilus]MBE1237802.1 hypothetical protein [Phaeovibrio sulfidiphilus]
MFNRPSQASAFNTLALRVAAILFTVMLVPSAANAAVVGGTTINLGALKGTGTVNEATQVGTFNSTFSAKLNFSGSEDLSIVSSARGAFGTPSGRGYGMGISAGSPSVAFTNNYTFSLERASNLSMNVFNGYEAVRRGLLAPGFQGLYNNTFQVTLTGDNGFSQTRDVTAASWAAVWSDLAAGNYTLSISGRYGYQRISSMSGMLLQGYGGVFNISDAAPGDVPLPGALILLGTAITGAGVWGRRRTRKTRAA